MRIVVNDIAASCGGALSILKDFYEYIKENDTENKWIFLLSDNYVAETEHIKVRILPGIKKNKLNKIIFDFISGKNYINKLKPDVVFSLQNIITFGLKVPQVVYIHQPIPFQDMKKFKFYKKKERKMAVYQTIIGRIINLSAQRSTKIIVQTKWMKEAVCRKAKIPESKVCNIIPVTECLQNGDCKEWMVKKHFFYPTSDLIYKNNECIYKACHILNGKGFRDFSVKLTLNSEQKWNNIDFVGRVSRKQVIDEYSKSTLIFPSYIESCALPPIEARQTGTIILASDCAFTREILEGYENAYFFNPFRPEELAVLMEKVMQSEIVIKKDSDTAVPPAGWGGIIKVIEDIS